MSARRLRRGRARRGRRLVLQDLLVEALGLRIRIDAELALEDGDARLILAQRGAPSSLAGVHADEGAVDVFLEGIEREQSYGGLRRFGERVLLRLHREQPGQRLHGPIAQAGPFRLQPRLERLLVHVQAFEQVAAVERDGLVERRRRALAHALLEAHHVDLRHPCVERDGLALGLQARRTAGQHAAQREERLAETVPRLLGGGITPEERDQLLARM
jgi:hypothetical protein